MQELPDVSFGGRRDLLQDGTLFQDTHESCLAGKFFGRRAVVAAQDNPAAADYTGQFFFGLIDEVAVYNTHHSTATAALVSPNFIIDQDETASKADLSSDLILSQRLEELVSEANRFRTKACGMGV